MAPISAQASTGTAAVRLGLRTSIVTVFGNFLTKHPGDGVARYHWGLPRMAVIPAAHLN